MTKRRVLAVVAFLAAACALGAQARPRLAVLPFTGGGGADGETIARLLGIQPELSDAFTPVSRTAAVEAIVREHRFQRSGLTDHAGVRELGRAVNADLARMRALARTINCAGASRIGEFERVPGGTFQMGSPAGAWASGDRERPVRSVTVSGFYMGRHPV